MTTSCLSLLKLVAIVLFSVFVTKNRFRAKSTKIIKDRTRMFYFIRYRQKRAFVPTVPKPFKFHTESRANNSQNPTRFDAKSGKYIIH
ncbi:unnamed protein product [Rhizophagus irregularis]|uniref:Uncharacterized protein n=1 Tax=Rhizophagus irregularis TaxID=588596 RepID=A0A915ZMS9_9GLOM|nr:unnamed protein product [Rhizophagus irregularis]